MNGADLAALIAAGCFAVVAGAAVYLLVKLARLASAATQLMAEYRGRADQLIDRAQAAVDRTNDQLARTDAVTASMGQVTTSMAELSAGVSALASLAGAVPAALGVPVTRLAALAYGISRAIAIRRGGPGTARSLGTATLRPGRAAPALTGRLTPAGREPGGGTAR
jgi:hypothetical protein